MNFTKYYKLQTKIHFEYTEANVAVCWAHAVA